MLLHASSLFCESDHFTNEDWSVVSIALMPMPKTTTEAYGLTSGISSPNVSQDVRDAYIHRIHGTYNGLPVLHLLEVHALML